MVAYLFEINGLSMIHFGSAAWVDSELDSLQPDIALLPVESPPQAEANVVRLAALLQPKLIIPHHWDSYHPAMSEIIDLSEFEAVIRTEIPHSKVFKPTLGHSFNPGAMV